MADAPKLNSATDATTARYAPLSWLAVTALAVAGLYVLILAVMGWQAFQDGQPLLQWWLFAMPAVGVFLAFIARRQIRGSEGARTGEGFANAAWWVCVVAGACYFAYLLANDLAVRADSERAVVQWGEKLAEADPNNPNDPAVWQAFEKTLDPGSPMIGNPQAAFSPGNDIPFNLFRNTPLLLIWARNRPDVTFTPNGLQSWTQTPDGQLTCEAAAILSCPEGDFPLVIPVQGVTVETPVPGNAEKTTKKRVWRVLPAPQGEFIKQLELIPRTRYGWLVEDLQRSAVFAADQFCQLLTIPPPTGPSAAIDRFISGRLSGEFTSRLIDPNELSDRMGVVGATAVLVGPTDPMNVPAADRPPHFFARTSGEPLTDAPFTRPDGQRIDNGLSTMRKVWEQAGLTGLAPTFKSRLRTAESAPKFPLVDISDPTKVVVKVPIDFQPRREDFGSRTFSTGYLVLVCDDPAAVQEMNDAREAAKAGRDTPTRDRPATSRDFPFRVVRMETDLLPILPPQTQAEGMDMGGM